ncbi:hypothetical protein GCM10010975_05060 [Comamonas phosphati]|nr:hypothetical protein GCM10010975_05060 [Comamonas phosphati]
MQEDKFLHVEMALQFFLLGKMADVPVEVRFLQLMVCVEAMDQVPDLKEETTAALLGVSRPAAKLLNCLRNKLVHGAGGYMQAFQKTLEEDFKGKPPVLEDGFANCLEFEGKLQFAPLWLRLCERLDAFWCAYVEVEPRLVEHRSAAFETALMHAVNLDLLKGEAEAVKAKKQRTGGSSASGVRSSV